MLNNQPPPPKHYHSRPGNTWGIFLRIKAQLEKRNPDTVVNEAYVIRFALHFTDKWLEKVALTVAPPADGEGVRDE